MSCALAIALSLLAQTGQDPGRTTVLVGGEVHPVSGPVIPEGTVILRGDTIAQVGAKIAVPAGAQVIDCHGRVITPGLIESFSQLGLVEILAVEETNDADMAVPEPIRAAARMDDAVDLRSDLIAVSRRHGLTSAIAAPVGGLISGRGAWLDLVDKTSPVWLRPVTGPVAMFATLGQHGATVAGGSRALSMMRLREVLDDARMFKKNAAAFDKNALRKLAASRLDLLALDDVLSKKLPLVIRVQRASDILAALRFQEEQQIRVALIDVDEGWLVADAIALANVPVIVNPDDMLPHSFERRAARPDNAVLLRKAGVKVAITTESSHNARNLRFMLGNEVRAGMPHEDALRAGTLTPAEIYGMEKRYGSIEPGTIANVVVWTGDPFEPSSYAERVYVRGRAQSLETRQTHLRDKYKAKQGL
jgi:imidazolonepropionase-like amidohydrolase